MKLEEKNYNKKQQHTHAPPEHTGLYVIKKL